MGKPFSLFGRELSAPKGHLAESHRARTPAETLNAYQRFMPMMGITRIANITGLDSIGLPTYTAIRPNSRALTTSQGKGLDDDAAQVSALMESIESWHAERIELPMRYESYAELSAGAAVADIHRLRRAAGRQVSTDTPLLWVAGEDLFGQRPTYVPYDLVTMNTVHPPEYAPTFFVSTDGLASGNHLLEALVHALCECIERDAAALWYASPAEPVAVDLDSVDDPACRQLLRLVREADVEAVAWDLTSDIGIPTYSCNVMEPPGRQTGRGLGFYHGFGCHLDATMALYRAIIEAVQGRVTFISGSRDDLLYAHYEGVRDPVLLEGMWREIIAGKPAARRWTGAPRLSTDSFEDDLRVLLAALEAAGLGSAIAVDLSHADVGIPVVRVIVPGLEIIPDPGAEVGARYLAAQGAENPVAKE